MKKSIITLLLFTALFTQAQVGIGVATASMDPSAQLEVASTTKGFLPPRMLASERASITTPAAGLLVFQTDAPEGLYYYTGSLWTIVGSSSNSSGVSSIGNVSNTSNSKGAALNGTEISLTPADSINGGIITAGIQKIAGAKTFQDGLTIINKPFLPPVLTQTEISALSSPSEGMVVYNSSTRKLQVYSVGNTDTTNELYSGNFSNGMDSITQTYVPQVGGTVYAFQFFAKKSIQNYPWTYLVVDYNSGGVDGIDLQSLTTSAEWITINVSNPFTVTAGNSYNFNVWSGSICGGDVLLGTNSNYSNGSITNSNDCIGGGLLNGDDLMFRILITPSSSSAYWLNLN